MASDKQQYRRALEKWDNFHRQKRYSVESGVVAVLCPIYGVGENQKEMNDDYERLRQDAEHMSWKIGKKGTDVYLDVNAGYDTFSGVIGDKAISSVVVVGHGDISSVYIEDGYKIDWRDISEMTTHLKTGSFEQRHCGQALRNLSVPMGMFSMYSHSRVIAPVGLSFEPELMTTINKIRIEETKLRQISHAARIGYEAVKRYFPGETGIVSDS